MSILFGLHFIEVVESQSTFYDSFDSVTLGSGYEIVNSEGVTFDLSANPGWLRVSFTSPGDRVLSESVANACMVLMEGLSGDFTVMTRVNATMDQDEVSAGILIWDNTLASALIPVIAGLGYFVGKETNSFWILVPVSVSLICFVIAIAIGIENSKPTPSDYCDPRCVIEKYKDQGKSTIFFLYTWASTIIETANNNANVINSKKRTSNYMYLSIIIGLAILVGSFMLLGITKIGG